MSENKEKYKNIKKLEDMIRSCSGIGDCREAYMFSVKREQVCPVYEHSPKFEAYSARGRLRILLGILEGNLEVSRKMAEVFYQCTTCGDCHTICHGAYHDCINLYVQSYIDHVKVWEAFRADLFDLGLAMPRHLELLGSMNENYNPYFEKHEDRIKWLGDRKFPETAENLFFMGCTEPYRMPDLIKTIFRVLDKVGIDYTIVHPNEVCCGSIALRVGDVNTAKNLAEKNIEAFKKSGAKRILVHCAGCYKTIKLNYPELLDLELPFEVVHITEVLDQLLDEGKVKLIKEVNDKVAYHDPCHLGRADNVYEAPRNLLKAIPGLEFIEFDRIKENAWCCGAGGGMKSAYADKAVEIAIDRIKEAEKIGVNKIASACPFCEMNLQDAINELDSEIEIIDVLELVDEALE
ncbi:MAG: (Fe-S)-binding protein [Promethearchaeota archaeon]|nr:MAG: (Fe-S)-binding protein [Candidatus Lokiarchaeota archaeon]